jgi:hypothetical protein
MVILRTENTRLRLRDCLGFYIEVGVGNLYVFTDSNTTALRRRNLLSPSSGST